MKRCVIISGGFNPIHGGHIDYISEARKFGDFLVVILATDEHTIQKRGKSFISFNERYKILFNIKGVDKVYKNIDEDTKCVESLKQIYQDLKGEFDEFIYAKGGDVTKENCLEEDICKELSIKTVYNVGGEKVNSSSWILKKYRDDCSE